MKWVGKIVGYGFGVLFLLSGLGGNLSALALGLGLLAIMILATNVLGVRAHVPWFNSPNPWQRRGAYAGLIALTVFLGGILPSQTPAEQRAAAQAQSQATAQANAQATTAAQQAAQAQAQATVDARVAPTQTAEARVHAASAQATAQAQAHAHATAQAIRARWTAIAAATATQEAIPPTETPVPSPVTLLDVEGSSDKNTVTFSTHGDAFGVAWNVQALDPSIGMQQVIITLNDGSGHLGEQR
jgi:hypothetical protein